VNLVHVIQEGLLEAHWFATNHRGSVNASKMLGVEFAICVGEIHLD